MFADGGPPPPPPRDDEFCKLPTAEELEEVDAESKALSASHTRIVWSKLADAKYFPEMLKSKEFTLRSCAKSSTVFCC
jgi:putative heme degradation protein